MRAVIITLGLCLSLLFSMAQPPNNAIFTGGNGDGYAIISFNQAFTNIYNGGVGDGWSNILYQQSGSAIYSGGDGDGWSFISFQQSSNAIYSGGDGDGWSSVLMARADNNIYAGGSGDGWSSTYKPMGPLPVTLLYFTASKENEHTARIEWKTSEEENVSHFEIERSEDAVFFSKVGSVIAKRSRAGATYNFSDAQVPAGTYYYRLKSVDLDGKFTYTPSRVLRFGNTTDPFARFYPNPTTDIVNISIPPDLKGQTIVINISNSSGAVIDQKRIAIQSAGVVQVKLGRYAKGLYFVQLKSKEINTTQRILLQ